MSTAARSYWSSPLATSSTDSYAFPSAGNRGIKNDSDLSPDSINAAQKINYGESRSSCLRPGAWHKPIMHEAKREDHVSPREQAADWWE